MRILIVENTPSLNQAVERAGEELQLKIDRATDGWEAIEKLETEEYAAIVIDADLPRHSGFGVLNYLREEVGGTLGNVIVMTSDRDDVRRKVSAGVTVLGKSDDEVAAALRLAVASGLE